MAFLVICMAIYWIFLFGFVFEGEYFVFIGDGFRLSDVRKGVGQFGCVV
jgi:hypothetical protein